MTEYYYEGMLRWSFGFDSPNKAGAFLAAWAPFLFLPILSIPASRWKTLSVWAVAGAQLLLLWGILLTFSRGALLGWGMGMLFLAWTNRTKFRIWLAPAFVVGATAILIAIRLGVMERTGSLAQDASVGNRWELWQGGLRMLWIAPGGVGQGQSGDFYMQWLQSLDRTEGYRTLVNSWLTFAAEFGVWSVALGVGLLVFVWCNTGTTQDSSARAKTGDHLAKAILIITGVCACFSTTLEETRILITPTLAIIWLGSRCGIALSGGSWSGLKFPLCKGLVASLSFTKLALGTGWLMNSRANEKISRNEIGIRISNPGSENSEQASLEVRPDPEVLGPDYGKRIRELAAIHAGDILVVLDKSTKPQLPRRILIGEHVNHMTGGEEIWLIAPLIPTPQIQEEMKKAKSETSPIRVFLPELESEEIKSFWIIHTMTSKLHHLKGVGHRVDWAWDEVMTEFSN